MADRKQQDRALRARRQSALARFELSLPRDAVQLLPSRGVTSPPVRELAPDIRSLIDAALSRNHIRHGRRGGRDG